MRNLSGLMAVLAMFLCSTVSYGQLYEKRINCGGPVPQTGVAFEADNLTTNSPYSNGEKIGSWNLQLDEVYKSGRYTKNADREMFYNISVPNPGEYQVLLHFAEPYWGVFSSGDGHDVRVFDVFVEGTQVANNLDIVQLVGPHAVHTITHTVIMSAGDLEINLEFDAELDKNDPIINAIEILEQAPADILVTGVNLADPTNPTMGIDDTQQLNATVSPATASNQNITWSSSDTSIATVNSSTGLVTAIAEGIATITVTTNDGSFTDNATITVTDPNNPPTGGNWTLSGDNAYRLTGNIGIGTANSIPTNGDPNYKLAVNGSIRAKEIKVETGWADYVFFKDYKLPTLQEVEKHINEKGHLINIPSAADVESNGIELGEMNKLLLEKIEELTLYTIEQEKRIKILEQVKGLKD